ncbi:MAG: 30S ribosomal protein S5, partial [Nanoarchaeota archaeon]
GCGGSHSIPCKIVAKCGSVIVEILPAPKGTGLAMEKEAAKILALAGIKDVYSRTYGQTRTKLNHLKAIFEALRLLAQVKIKPAMNKAVAKEQ